MVAFHSLAIRSWYVWLYASQSDCFGLCMFSLWQESVIHFQYILMLLLRSSLILLFSVLRSIFYGYTLVCYMSRTTKSLCLSLLCESIFHLFSHQYSIRLVSRLVCPFVAFVCVYAAFIYPPSHSVSNMVSVCPMLFRKFLFVAFIWPLIDLLMSLVVSPWAVSHCANVQPRQLSITQCIAMFCGRPLLLSVCFFIFVLWPHPSFSIITRTVSKFHHPQTR